MAEALLVALLERWMTQETTNCEKQALKEMEKVKDSMKLVAKEK